MRRLLLLAGSIASLALPGAALAGGGDYGFDGGTKAQRGQVRSALEASTFDWNTVPTRVTIHVKPNIPTQATPGHIWLDAGLVSSGSFAWAAIQDEYAHQVDFSRFDAATREPSARSVARPSASALRYGSPRARPPRAAATRPRLRSSTGAPPKPSRTSTSRPARGGTRHEDQVLVALVGRDCGRVRARQGPPRFPTRFFPGLSGS